MKNKLQIVYKPLDELNVYSNNPRFNDDAVEYVANSIKEFGFKVPIVIDKDNVIVAGHTRYKASMELGLKEVPCIIADDLTDEQVKAFIGQMPIMTLAVMTIMQVLIKTGYEVIILPITRLVVNIVSKHEEKECLN